jgi:hypothetical protein
MEREALWLQMAVQRPSSLNAISLTGDGRSSTLLDIGRRGKRTPIQTARLFRGEQARSVESVLRLGSVDVPQEV